MGEAHLQHPLSQLLTKVLVGRAESDALSWSAVLRGWVPDCKWAVQSLLRPMGGTHSWSSLQEWIAAGLNCWLDLIYRHRLHIWTR